MFDLPQSGSASRVIVSDEGFPVVIRFRPDGKRHEAGTDILNIRAGQQALAQAPESTTQGGGWFCSEYHLDDTGPKRIDHCHGASVMARRDSSTARPAPSRRRPAPAHSRCVAIQEKNVHPAPVSAAVHGRRIGMSPLPHAGFASYRIDEENDLMFIRCLPPGVAIGPAGAVEERIPFEALGLAWSKCSGLLQRKLGHWKTVFRPRTSGRST